MRRVKATKRVHQDRLERRKEWPAVVYFWAFGLAILSYAVARAVLDGKPHPIHWLAALLGGLLGISLGWLWFRLYGDIF